MAVIENVTFLPAALQDIRDTHDWYKAQKQNLGKEFTKEVLNGVESLQENVVVHRFFFSPVRYVRLKRFPYSIFYQLDGPQENLLIVAVLGNKQDQLTILSNRLPS